MRRKNKRKKVNTNTKSVKMKNANINMCGRKTASTTNKRTKNAWTKKLTLNNARLVPIQKTNKRKYVSIKKKQDEK